MKKWLMIIMVSALAGPALAQSLRTALPEVRTEDASAGAVRYSKADSAGLRLIANRFFEKLKEKKVDAAYDQLTENSALADRKSEIEALKQQTLKAIEMFGEVSGSELVSEEPVASRLVRLTFLSYGSKYPLRWRFYFYKPAQAWALIDIRVDDNLVRMFGEEADESE